MLRTHTQNKKTHGYLARFIGMSIRRSCSTTHCRRVSILGTNFKIISKWIKKSVISWIFYKLFTWIFIKQPILKNIFTFFLMKLFLCHQSWRLICQVVTRLMRVNLTIFVSVRHTPHLLSKFSNRKWDERWDRRDEKWGGSYVFTPLWLQFFRHHPSLSGRKRISENLMI